jgi:hypothetical protein
MLIEENTSVSSGSGERFLVTIPLHVAYLAALFCSERAFPSVMTMAVIFIPLLAIAFGVESILFYGRCGSVIT